VKDFKIVQARTVLKVTSVSPVRNFSPPALIVLGQDLNSTVEILYNDVAAPEFVIMGTGRLVVRIPDSQVGVPLRSLLVLADSAVSTQDAQISLNVGRGVRMVGGLDRLIQQFLLELFTTPGSDIFDQASGGGARSIIGKAVTDGHGATAELSMAVDRTKKNVFRAQANNRRIPPEERLLSASLSSVRFDSETTTLYGVIDLRNVVGDAALVTVR